jgi:hypothetical protein
MGYSMGGGWGWGLLGSLPDRLVGGMIASTGECGLVGPEGLNDTPMPVACYCMGRVCGPHFCGLGERVFWAALNGI